jgi:hypothetical protein
MRNNLLFALGITTTLLCVQAEDPIQVVKNFEAAIVKKDFAKAERYVSATYRQEYEILKAEKQAKPVKTFPESVYILKKKTSQTAMVFAAFKNVYNEGMNVYLSKQKGKWMIDSSVFISTLSDKLY